MAKMESQNITHPPSIARVCVQESKDPYIHKANSLQASPIFPPGVLMKNVSAASRYQMSSRFSKSTSLYNFGALGSVGVLNIQWNSALITYDTVAFGTALCSAGQTAKDFCRAAPFVLGFLSSTCFTGKDKVHIRLVCVFYLVWGLCIYFACW